jgi:molybdopterin/thiamine biosynthesis adenylyltransferase
MSLLQLVLAKGERRGFMALLERSQHLLNPLSDALLPVGTRGYGAAVYSNLANASVSDLLLRAIPINHDADVVGLSNLGGVLLVHGATVAKRPP